ncbi:uncharacterized [Tachysurus ichikawai]
MYRIVHVSRDCMFFWVYFEVQDGKLCLCTFPELYRKAGRKFQAHSGKSRVEQSSVQQGSDTGQRCVRCLMVLQAWDLRHLTLALVGLHDPFPLLQALSSTDSDYLSKRGRRKSACR